MTFRRGGAAEVRRQLLPELKRTREVRRRRGKVTGVLAHSAQKRSRHNGGIYYASGTCWMADDTPDGKVFTGLGRSKKESLGGRATLCVSLRMSTHATAIGTMKQRRCANRAVASATSIAPVVTVTLLEGW